MTTQTNARLAGREKPVESACTGIKLDVMPYIFALSYSPSKTTGKEAKQRKTEKR